MDKGYIYIIRNENFPNFVKIGITKNIDARLRSYQTSSPHRNYILEHFIEHPNYRIAERIIHDKMKMFALSRKNEWFEISLDMAKSVVDSVLDTDDPIHLII